MCVVVAKENVLEDRKTDRRLLEYTAAVIEEKNTPILSWRGGHRGPRYKNVDKVSKFCVAQFAHNIS